MNSAQTCPFPLLLQPSSWFSATSTTVTCKTLDGRTYGRTDWSGVLSVCCCVFSSPTSPVSPGCCRPVLHRKASLCWDGTDRLLLHSWLPHKPWPGSRCQNQARPHISVVHPRQRGYTVLTPLSPSFTSQTGSQQSAKALMFVSIPSIDPNKKVSL